jgi:hypothetical protein
MKFSIKVAALAALALFSSSVNADSMSDAIEAFCGGKRLCVYMIVNIFIIII